VRDPSHADNEMPVAQRAAQALKLELQAVEIREPADIDRALAAAKQANVDGLYIVSSRQTTTNVQRIVEFANRERLPLVGGWGGWVQAGGLMSYGPNVADKVLKGMKPGDLPIQQPTRFELLVNLKTAKALGLNIPDSFLLRAEKVIE
jgi:putative ABC transport system substrate-binding protein